MHTANKYEEVKHVYVDTCLYIYILLGFSTSEGMYSIQPSSPEWVSLIANTPLAWPKLMDWEVVIAIV